MTLKHCLAYSLPNELSPLRRDDHIVDLVPGSSPPNWRAYRVSACQKEEIMKQGGELWEKG